MAGRHSKRGARAARNPAQRRVGVELVDADTRLAHRVDTEALVGALGGGRATTFCGASIRAASLIDPGRGRCRECAP